jgi:molybdopterin/thiamine biosynthesis adenylyltransferase/rhodanese-related sulfurtransferase
MNNDFLRYSCQMALPGFSERAQRRLQNARVLVVGAGGLGCPAALYLAAAGVGTIYIADFDTVSISNLHRQVLYNPGDVGKNKSRVACERLQLQNPGIRVVPFDQQVTRENVMELVYQCDIIVDGSDNFEARYLLNDAAVLAHKPLVYGAIYQFEGQVAVWNIENPNGSWSPNYRDLFPEVDSSQIPNCSEGGVISTLAGIIGCMQANEVIKYITQTGDLLAGKILVLDAQTLASRTIKIAGATSTQIENLPAFTAAPTLSAEEVRRGMAENTIILIDVRTSAEREAFNIGGEHLPFGEADFPVERLNSKVRNVFYCATGRRSEEMVKAILQKLPGANVFSLHGGLKEWAID